MGRVEETITVHQEPIPSLRPEEIRKKVWFSQNSGSNQGPGKRDPDRTWNCKELQQWSDHGEVGEGQE